jgi:2-dehydro-3-deoxyphosphogluconate aldolase/(4S)-4-hydroxy-2-oxoglutarate aldolase
MGINARIRQTVDEVLADGVILCIRLGADAPIPVVDACRAAVRGGLRVLEITLTTPGALDAIRELSKEDVIVGGGTVLSIEDVIRVGNAGGRFVLSPVFDPRVVAEAHLCGMLSVPGASTPTEILAAHRHGARMVKVFPAGPLGGPAYLRAIRGPLPDVPMVPTSGATAETLHEYLDAGAVAIGVGNEVFPPGFTLESVEKAARRVREAMDLARKR